MVNELGKLIRERRKAKNLTQAQLAALVGREQTAVSDWERGVTTPNADVYDELSEALGITRESLLMALAANVLAEDEVEAAILQQTRLDFPTRQALVMIYKSVLTVHATQTK